MNSTTAATAAPEADFSSANPHALASILEASQTQSIIAARDIFDIAGTKLWARDLPVSQALQRKLLDRQLREPLESCLQAKDGVDANSLVSATEAMLTQDTPLTALLRPHAAAIVREAGRLPVHPVAQLLLTAAKTARPATLPPRHRCDGTQRRAADGPGRQAVRAAHRDAVRPASRPGRDCTSRPSSARPMPTARSICKAISNWSCTRMSGACWSPS